MRLLAITRQTQPKEALHNRPDFADLAPYHDLCIVCPVPWTAVMHAVVGGFGSDTSEWSDGIQVICPTYYATPGLQKHRETLHQSHTLLDESLWQPRASSVAVIGLHMVLLGQTSVPETLEPVYVRPSYAEEKRPVP